MRLLSSIILLAVSNYLSAQNNFIFKVPGQPYNPWYYSLNEVRHNVTIDGGTEKMICAKADSSLLAYLNNYKSKNPNYANTLFESAYPAHSPTFSEVEKYFTQKPLDERWVSVYWNQTLDTLYGYNFANIYWIKSKSGGGKYIPYTVPVYEYKKFMTPADYEAFLNLFISKVQGVFSIVKNYTTTCVPADTVVLHHAGFEKLTNYIGNSFQEGTLTVYADSLLKIPRTLDYLNATEYIEGPVVKDGNMEISYDTAITYRKLPLQLIIKDLWHFDTNPDSINLPQNKYRYAFVANRNIHLIGIATEDTKDKSWLLFNDLKNIITILNKRPERFVPYEESLKSIFYKKYILDKINY